MSVFNQPVTVGDVLEVEIEDTGDQGDGMAFVDGLAIYTPGTVVGEQVRIRIERVANNCAFAEVWGGP